LYKYNYIGRATTIRHSEELLSLAPDYSNAGSSLSFPHSSTAVDTLSPKFGQNNCMPAACSS